MIILFMCIIIQIILLFDSILRIKKFIFDFCAIFQLLFLIFYTLPAWGSYFGWTLFSYETMKGYGLSTTSYESLIVLFKMTIIMLLFSIGYNVADKLSIINKKIIGNCNKKPVLRNYYLWQLLLFLIWFLVMYSQYRKYGGSPVYFLMPTRKQGISTGFESTMQIVIPQVMLVLKIKLSDKSIDLSNLKYIFLILISVISSAQRRDIVIAIMFIALLNIYLRVFKNGMTKKTMYGYFSNKKIKRKIYVFFIFLTALIPTLWYMRNFSNQLARGDKIVMPWKIRGFTELIFGSSATGFDSSIVVNWYDKVMGVPFFHCIRFLMVFFIPRAIYPNKQMLIPQLIKTTRGDWGNISLFFVNDMYYSFGILSILIVPIIGFIINKMYVNCLKSNNITKVSYAIFMFSNIIMLFKNGLAQFMMFFMIYFIILNILDGFIFKKKYII